jgi:ribosomal protein S18 acetylase RimI-like enzyme
MMKKIVIRDLDYKSLDAFHSLFTDVMINDFPEYTKEKVKYFLKNMYTRDHFRTFLNSPFRKILVACKGKDIIGFLVGDQTFGGVGFISWIGVSKAHRKNGVGTSLIDHYAKFCKTKKGHLIEAYTFAKTVGFYEHIGFIKIGRREKGYFGVENIIMDRAI